MKDRFPPVSDFFDRDALEQEPIAQHVSQPVRNVHEDRAHEHRDDHESGNSREVEVRFVEDRGVQDRERADRDHARLRESDAEHLLADARVVGHEGGGNARDERQQEMEVSEGEIHVGLSGWEGFGTRGILP